MSSAGCDRCKERQIPCIVLQGKTACDACHKVHTKCSLQPQSRTRLPQKKASHVVQALVELGLVGAEVHRPASQVSSWCRQVDSCTGEFVPGEISQFEEMRHGLVNTQRRLRELERLKEECKRRKQWRREERAAQAAAMEPERAGESQRAKVLEELVVPPRVPHGLCLALRDRVRAWGLRFLRLSFRWFPQWTTRVLSR
jgi:hypothetical protein